MIDRTTFDKTVMDWTPSDINTTKVYYLNARPEMGRFEIKLEKEDWLDFVELTLADWMEQVEGASWKANPIFFWDAGMAYSYRRLAYQKMSTILLQERNKTVAVEMYEAVMATESEETKDLHQPRTPPMSEASAAALAALRANGEDIPEDLSPSKKECLADYSGTSTS